MPVTSNLFFKFDVSRLPDCGRGVNYYSRLISVAHKNVGLDFVLFLKPVDARPQYANWMGVYLSYVDGPKEEIVLDFEMIVCTDFGSFALGRVEGHKFAKEDGGWGFPQSFPPQVEELARQRYLSENGSMLSITARLTIPSVAFDDPDGSRQIFVDPDNSQMDLFRLELFNELTTPMPTNQPYSERFELRTNDGCSFWAHKKMLSFSSEVFREWLDPNKPPEAQSKCFKDGVMAVNLSNDAMYHMLYLIYLGETCFGFSEFAWEILESAERFQFRGLKRICERSLLAQIGAMSLDALFSCLRDSHTFGLVQLNGAAAAKLVEYLNPAIVVVKAIDEQVSEQFLTNLLEFAHQHEHTAVQHACETKLMKLLNLDIEPVKFVSLASLARKCELPELGKWCTKWMGKNYDALRDGGHLKELMDDKSDEGQGVIDFLMHKLSINVQQQ